MFADAALYAIGATPLLIPILAVGTLGDPAVLRAVLWQGNLAALFIAMVQEFLSLVVGPAVFVVVRRADRRQRFYVAALAAILSAGVLLLFTSLPLAIFQLGALTTFLVLARPRRSRWWNRSRAGSVALVVLVTATVAGGCAWSANQDGPLDSRVWEVFRARALYGLPREVAVQTNREVTVYYLVSSDEHQTTAITGFPNNVAVINIRTDDIVVRLPCRPAQDGSDRSVADLVIAADRRGGTAYCGELAECLRTVPRHTTGDGDVVDRCVRRASGL